MSKNNIDIYDAIPSVGHLIEENIKLKKENQELEDKVKELEFLNEHLNKYIDNFRQNSDIQYLHDNQQIYKLKQAIKILKDSLGLYLVNKKFDKRIVYALMSKTLGMCLLNPTQEQYKLLEEVFESVGE